MAILAGGLTQPDSSDFRLKLKLLLAKMACMVIAARATALKDEQNFEAVTILS
jgi:hypothetical protein